MHMSDALITPVIGGTMMVASIGIVGYSLKKLKIDLFEKRIPLMAVMGAFLFSAQMINFSIPGTGSSGHIGGGILLAIILGPSGGFLTMACVLLIQALFFADGGLLAFGCNLINLGFFTSYVAYPLLFKPYIKNGLNKRKIIKASIIASIVGLQLGSLGVVIETILSGRTELGLGTFLLFMQPIHLGIGLVEGIITGVVVTYLFNQSPHMIYTETLNTTQNWFYKKNILRIAVITLIIGGFVSLFASSNPDGLEWALEIAGGSVETSSELSFQDSVAPLPDYGFRSETISPTIGTSASGIVGSLITLICTFMLGILIRKRSHWKKSSE